jgi:hypothetical protein
VEFYHNAMMIIDDRSIEMRGIIRMKDWIYFYIEHTIKNEEIFKDFID